MAIGSFLYLPTSTVHGHDSGTYDRVAIGIIDEGILRRGYLLDHRVLDHSNMLLFLPIKLRELDAGLIRRGQLINYFIGEPMALWP